jgi:oxalate decarboxylase/phosphoglucose isomerase-like protein (cupin superfamily)
MIVTLKPGALRELHWHPNASEWQLWLAGQGRNERRYERGKSPHNGLPLRTT